MSFGVRSKSSYGLEPTFVLRGRGEHLLVLTAALAPGEGRTWQLTSKAVCRLCEAVRDRR